MKRESMVKKTTPRASAIRVSPLSPSLALLLRHVCVAVAVDGSNGPSFTYVYSPLSSGCLQRSIFYERLNITCINLITFIILIFLDKTRVSTMGFFTFLLHGYFYCCVHAHTHPFVCTHGRMKETWSMNLCVCV